MMILSEAKCQEANARGAKVKEWLEARGISHDTYLFLYLKQSFGLPTFPML